jgi:ABC-type polysaccharide transport system permease subunit
MIIFLSGLQDIPREYYEAARIDGASSWKMFTQITLPLLRPTSFFVLLASLDGVRGFGFSGIRSDLCHDQRRTCKFDVARGFLHLSAGVQIQ